MVAPSDNSINEPSTNSLDHTGEGVIIDIGTGEVALLRNVRRICAEDALLEVVIGIDPVRDKSELERLGVQPLTLAVIDAVLVPNYAAAGFEIIERGLIAPSDWPALETSWAKRLQGNEQRPITYLIARAA